MSATSQMTATLKPMKRVRSELLTVVKMIILLFWVVTPCVLMSRYHRFRDRDLQLCFLNTLLHHFQTLKHMRISVCFVSTLPSCVIFTVSVRLWRGKVPLGFFGGKIVLKFKLNCGHMFYVILYTIMIQENGTNGMRFLT